MFPGSFLSHRRVSYSWMNQVLSSFPSWAWLCPFFFSYLPFFVANVPKQNGADERE